MDQNNSRVKNSTRNIFFGALSYAINIFMKFFVRALFIRFLAVEYLGINSLFSDILNVLSLAELGIGNSIIYSMYKPIANNDIEKIKALVGLYRKAYLIIALIITIVGLVLIPFLPKLIKDAPNVDVNLTIVYLLFLFQTVSGYFFAYRRSLIFAYQRNDVESKVATIVNTLSGVFQILAIVLIRNYYAYLVFMVLTGFVDGLIVYLLSFKMFPQIKGKFGQLSKDEIKTISKNTGAMMMHKIGSAVVYSTDSIIISAFIGSAVLGCYSNYVLVTGAIVSVILLVNTALKGSIGNFIVTAEPETVYKFYKALNMLLMWLLGFVVIGLVICFQDFIALYTGKLDMLLDNGTMMLICLSFFLTQSRTITNNFKECAGLFWNDRYKPAVESVLNLVLDIVLVQLLGIKGVILATIISTIIVPLWIEPYVLYKNYFKISLSYFFIRYLTYAFIIAVAFVPTYFATKFLPTGNIMWFLLKFSICCIIPNIIFFAFAFKTKEFKLLLNKTKNFIHR